MTDERTAEERIMLNVGKALNRVHLARVIPMDLMIVSVKGDEDHTVKFSGMRSVYHEIIQLLEGMVAWTQRSGVIIGENLFTRRALHSRWC